MADKSSNSKPHDLRTGGTVSDKQAQKYLPEAWAKAQKSKGPITGRSLVKSARKMAAEDQKKKRTSKKSSSKKKKSY